MQYREINGQKMERTARTQGNYNEKSNIHLIQDLERYDRVRKSQYSRNKI